jgi:CarD family transcriptional regulator
MSTKKGRLLLLLIARAVNSGGLMYNVGQLAIHPAQGVAEIVAIEYREALNKRHKFYVLRIKDMDMRIVLPAAKAEEILRELASGEEIEQVFEVLRGKAEHIDRPWNRQYRQFMEKIKSGLLLEVAEVYRDLHCLQRTRKLSFGERRMLETSKSLLVKELAYARGLKEANVEKELQGIIK